MTRMNDPYESGGAPNSLEPPPARLQYFCTPTAAVGERTMERGADLIAWPPEGVSRVPYAVFSDPALHRLEQERIFRGPTWHFLALEAELPEPGSFKTTHVGDTPVIV